MKKMNNPKDKKASKAISKSDSMISIVRVDSKIFFKDFNQESRKAFSGFLHSGHDILYSKQEKAKAKLIRTATPEDASVYLLATHGGKIIGRSFSEPMFRDTLFMCMSFVEKKYQGKGIYTQLMNKTIKLAKTIGYLKLQSLHNSTNNAIIIPKLKAGFVITGIKVNAGYGTLAELTYFLSKNEKDATDFRTGFKRPTKNVKAIMKL